MRTYELRNRTAKLVVAEVTVDDPAKLLQAAAEVIGCTLDELALSLGNSAEEAQKALEIVEVFGARHSGKPELRFVRNRLPRRSLFAVPQAKGAA